LTVKSILLASLPGVLWAVGYAAAAADIVDWF